MINQESSFISRAALAALVACLGLLLLFGGCGSSDDGGDTASAAPTKAAFIKQADAICEETDSDQKALLKAYFDKHPNAKATQAVKEDVVTVSLPPIQTEAEELSALAAPAGDEEKVGAYIGSIEKAVAAGEADPSTMINEKAGGPFAEANKLGGEYGFKACDFPL